MYEIVLINATWPLLLLVMPTKQLAWTAVLRTVAIGLLTAKCLLAQCGRLAGDGRALLHLKTEGGVPQGRDREGGNGLVRHLHLFAVSGRSLSGVFVRHALSADFHLSYLLLFWCRVSLLISLSRCYTIIFFSSLRRFRVLRLDRPFPSPVRNRLLHLGKSGRSSVTAYSFLHSLQAPPSYITCMVPGYFSGRTGPIFYIQSLSLSVCLSFDIFRLSHLHG